jgi:hypothetical protein
MPNHRFTVGPSFVALRAPWSNTVLLPVPEERFMQDNAGSRNRLMDIEGTIISEVERYKTKIARYDHFIAEEANRVAAITSPRAHIPAAMPPPTPLQHSSRRSGSSRAGSHDGQDTFKRAGSDPVDIDHEVKRP